MGLFKIKFSHYSVLLLQNNREYLTVVMASTNEPKISKSDCHQIIARKLQTENFTLVGFEEKKFQKVQGFLGDHFSLSITIKHKGNEETHSFFVKSLPSVQSQKKFVVEINGFYKEIGFFTTYQDLLKNRSINILQDSVPSCYFTKDTNLVFEDLSVKGYTICSSREPLSLNYVKLTLQNLAKLHASGLILEEKASFKLNEKLEKELAETFFSDGEMVRKSIDAYKTGAYAFIDLSHDNNMKISQEWFKQKVDEVLDLQKLYACPSRKFRNTICHGDVWTQNFMYKIEQGQPKNCVLVDFQATRYGPPAQDVLAFLHLTTNREFRDKHREELLCFYHQELNSILERFDLKDLITKEEFDASCRFYKRYALVKAIVLLQIVTMSQEAASELFSNQEKALSVFFEDKYDFMIEISKKDPIFRNIYFEALAELREFFEEQM